ncbi:tetratricopeptide repeat protein [Streptomyces sp. NBC_00102]|uniref:ATP-binding protein n=1 Tax=Streptomyces sp. NBC_00102 TaxID=2975652 RepID=UPI00225980D1|nr:helix-turn-helix domain-containing protein [Streptomyces sp. NBC_00102]MCX5402198.1 tetratricopeptide repeat protein [Streptomyces sp. NBC_00102]
MEGDTFGRLLRDARQRSLLTLESLADASGVSVRAISDMERGRSLPRQSTLAELLDALAPDDESRRRLLAAARSGTSQGPRQLPPDLAVFRGRDTVLTALREATEGQAGNAGHVVISAIGGLAGVGKTALAVHWAHRVSARFPDGQLYVNLRGFEDSGDPLDPADALGSFLRALGTPSLDIPSGTGPRAELFRRTAASRRLVVLLDNARDAEQVRPLLPASPGCLTIVTSRNRLVGLAAADGARLISLDVWTPEEAVAALAARIGAERCRREPEAAGELVRLCGYLPLAVAVVGAQLTVEPRLALRFAVAELRQSRPGLDAFAATDRAVDVRAVFARSYRALSPVTARFFRHLALHPGPAVSAQAAASLADVPVPQARGCLRELSSASLISRDSEGRYVLHDLVRSYGAELADQEHDDRRGAENRLLGYLHHNAQAANRLILPQFRSGLPDDPPPGVVRVPLGDRQDALDWYRQEEETAAGALHTMTGPGLPRRQIDVALEWVTYHEVTGRWTEEIAATRMALEAAVRLDDPVSVERAGHNLVRALIETGRGDEAAEPLAVRSASLPLLSPEHRAPAERRASWVCSRLGRHDEALSHARQALAIARTLGHSDELGRALIEMAFKVSERGEHLEAVALCEEALPVLRESGEPRYEAVTWGTLGIARLGLGQLDAAIDCCEKALALFEANHDIYNQAETLDNLASVRLERGEPEQARAHWYRAAGLFAGLRIARADEMRAKAEAVPHSAGT